MITLQGRAIAFLVAPEGVEQVELTTAWQAVAEAGGTPRLVSTEPGRVQAYRHLDRADTFPVDVVVGEVTADDYAGLVLPGGVANPDILRLSPEAVGFTRAFFEQGRPVAAICHAPWLLIEAGVVAGRVLASWPSLRTDLTNAGATWADHEVEICHQGPNVLITSRTPADLPAFTEALVSEFAKATKP